MKHPVYGKHTEFTYQTHWKCTEYPYNPCVHDSIC